MAYLAFNGFCFFSNYFDVLDTILQAKIKNFLDFKIIGNDIFGTL